MSRRLIAQTVAEDGEEGGGHPTSPHPTPPPPTPPHPSPPVIPTPLLPTSSTASPPPRLSSAPTLPPPIPPVNVPSPELLLPFLPRLLLDIVDRSSSTLLPLTRDQSFALSLPSSLLLIDVAGFTALTERMAKRSLSDLEKLSASLYEFFSFMLSHIKRYKGDLLKVAGDALIVLFCPSQGRGEVESPSSACERAIACAFSLQSTGDFVSPNGLTLRLHIGVASGPTTHIGVGGVTQNWRQGQWQTEEESATPASPPLPLPPFSALTPSSTAPFPSSPSPPSTSISAFTSSFLQGGVRREFLAFGPPFQRLKSCVEQSAAGEVVVDGLTWENIRSLPHVKGVRTRGDSNNWRLEYHIPQDGMESFSDPSTASSPTHTASALHPSVASSPIPLFLSSFVMPAVLSRFALQASSPSNQWMGEYRRVSVLFLSLPDPQLWCGGLPSLPSSTLTIDPPWLQPFHSLFRRVQRCVFQLSGQIRQLLVDDKGCTCVVAFGLPPLAREDDAVRAVMAAMNIVEEVKRGEVDRARAVLSVGVTTGRVWCGGMGSDERMEYVMIGDVVNLSARIMGSPVARGRVLCDEATVKACGGRMVWAEQTESIQAKGKADLIALREPLGKPMTSSPSAGRSPFSTASSSRRSSLTLFPPPFSPSSTSFSTSPPPPSPPSPALTRLPSLHSPGPGAEQSREDTAQGIFTLLFSHLESSVDSPATPPPAPIVLVEGRAGQGKSYLLQSLLREFSACHPQVTALVAVTDGIEANTPYFALIPLLRDILDLERTRLMLSTPPSSSPSLDDEAVLLSLLPPSDRPYATLLSDLLYLRPLSDNSSSPGGAVDAPLRPTLSRQLMLSVLRSHCLRNHRTVLVVEDGQWLDIHSWQLMKAVVESLPSLPLLIATRPVDRPPEPSSPSNAPTVAEIYWSIRPHPRTQRFILQPLVDGATLALARSSLRCESMDPALAALICSRSDGIPLFIHHLCLYMLERSLVVIDGGHARISSADALDASMPDSLESLLISVLDQLQPEIQLTVKVASVVGRHFMCSLVAASHPLHVSQRRVKQMMVAAQHGHIISDISETVHSPADADSGVANGHMQSNGDESNDDDADVLYHFTHQLVCEAAYSLLLYRQRRELHATVADIAAALKEKHPQMVSVPFLAHHYWLALCDAKDTLIDQPSPPLLSSCIETLLQSATLSLINGAVDDGAGFLKKAARCIRLVQDVEGSQLWEHRWLSSLFGTELISNVPHLVDLTSVWRDEVNQQKPSYVVASKCLRDCAERQLTLLALPHIRSASSPLQLERGQFNTLAALWFSSLPLGRQLLVEASRALTAFAMSAEGGDAGYYRLEAFRAAIPTFAMADDDQEVPLPHALIFAFLEITDPITHTGNAVTDPPLPPVSVSGDPSGPSVGGSALL